MGRYSEKREGLKCLGWSKKRMIEGKYIRNVNRGKGEMKAQERMEKE